jgi:hypothetical protein
VDAENQGAFDMSAELDQLAHVMKALEPNANRKLKVVRVPNPLNNCGDCGTPDRFGDFRVVTIRGEKLAVCDECSKYY